MEAQRPSKKAVKSLQSGARPGALHMSPPQAALAPTGPSSSSPKSAPGSAVLIRREAKHHVPGPRCPGGAVPGATGILPSTWPSGDPAGRALCLAKLGHAVKSSDVADRAKNTGRAKRFPSSCEGPWPRRVGLWL